MKLLKYTYIIKSQILNVSEIWLYFNFFKSSMDENLTKGKRTPLQELKERHDIVITKTGKGGAVVMIDVKDYVREAESQLKNKDNYNRLKYDPTETHKR